MDGPGKNVCEIALIYVWIMCDLRDVKQALRTLGESVSLPQSLELSLELEPQQAVLGQDTSCWSHVPTCMFWWSPWKAAVSTFGYHRTCAKQSTYKVHTVGACCMSALGQSLAARLPTLRLPVHVACLNTETRSASMSFQQAQHAETKTQGHLCSIISGNVIQRIVDKESSPAIT